MTSTDETDGQNLLGHVLLPVVAFPRGTSDA